MKKQDKTMTQNPKDSILFDLEDTVFELENATFDTAQELSKVQSDLEEVQNFSSVAAGVVMDIKEIDKFYNNLQDITKELTTKLSEVENADKDALRNSIKKAMNSVKEALSSIQHKRTKDRSVSEEDDYYAEDAEEFANIVNNKWDDICRDLDHALISLNEALKEVNNIPEDVKQEQRATSAPSEKDHTTKKSILERILEIIITLTESIYRRVTSFKGTQQTKSNSDKKDVSDSTQTAISKAKPTEAKVSTSYRR